MKSGKVLITGGLGFIGRHIAELLVKQGQPVLLFDNLSPQTHGPVPQFPACELVRHPWVEIFRGDVRRPADWEKVLPGVSYVVHLAAETGTAQSMYEISRYTETNVGGTAALLDYLANRKHGVGKIILGSSRAVYGEGAYRCVQCGPVYPPMRSDERLRCGQWEPLCPSCGNSIEAAATPEGAKLAPASIYAATKLAQEDLVRIAARAMGIPAVILRMQNVYGEGQSLKNPYTGILSILSSQLRLGKTLNLYEDGEESRDFVHVTDVARAVAFALNTGLGDGCILNVGSGCASTIAEVDTTNVLIDVDGYFVPAKTGSLTYYPLPPCRILDTRPESGGDGPLTGGIAKDLNILNAPGCTVPATAKAYSLNISAVPDGPLYYLTVWPATGGGQPPIASTLNDSTGTIVANAAIVAAGIGGDVAVYPTNDTNLIIDINGYFAAPGAPGALSLYVSNPCRVLDTRQAGGAFSGPLVVDVVNSPCGLPATARAYVMNATVLPEGPLWYLTLWPDGGPQPGVSVLNAGDGDTTNNMAIVSTTNGSIDAYAPSLTQLILDVSNYFAP